jgi:putative ABC transport system permease protein
MLKDYFNISFQGLKQRRLRSWLTMLGIFIGIATIVALISLGQGLNDAVFSQFSFLSADVLTITAGTSATAGAWADNSKPMTTKEFEAVESTSGIKAIAPRNMQGSLYQYKDFLFSGMVASIPPGEYGNSVYDIAAIKVEFGDRVSEGDKGKVLVGYNIANQDLLPKPLKVGDVITINEENFEIHGIIEKKGSFILDNMIAMNEDDMFELFDMPEGEYAIIGAQIEPDADMKEVILELEKRLRKVRDVKEEDQDFTVDAALDTLKQMEASLFGVKLFLYIIAGISLVVGGIGIMNTMFTSVLERTKEIGVMKAIGARNDSIFTLFFIESGLLGTVGGIIGISLGTGLAIGAEYIGKTFLNTELIQANLSPWLLGGALLFSFFLGAISGILPAMQASKLHPVDALRKSK